MEQFKVIAFGLMMALLAFESKAGEPADTTPRVFAELKSYQNCDMGRYEKHFLGSLNYPDCNKIIESGLAQVAMLKLAQPQTAMRKLKRKVDELIMLGESPGVRYKAYLTSVVFEHPDYFNDEIYGSYANGDAFFAALAERLQKKVLALR